MNRSKKTVFATHSEVAHSWATQSQPFGRSPTPSGAGGWFRNGNDSADCPRVRYVGRVFYSYQTPVARLEPIHGREALCLLTVPNEWGPATRGHIADAAGAVSHLIDAGEGKRGRAFEVPHIGGYLAGADYWQRRGGLDDRGEVPTPSAVDHAGNLSHLIQVYRDAAATFRNKRGEIWRGWIPGWKWEPGQDSDAGRLTEAETVAADLREKWAAVCDYAEFFGPLHLPADFPRTFADVEREAGEIMAARTERAARALARLTPREIERREAAKAKRAADKERIRALRFAGQAENLAAWREGLRVDSYRLPRAEYAYLRATGVKRGKAGEIIGGTLETSWGARVPLREAVRVFQFLKCVRESGEGWRPQGLRGIRVGDFAVNSIEPSGDFVAGCHRFAWPEIAALAESLGVMALPCNRAAVAE